MFNIVLNTYNCVKCVRMRSFFGPHSVRMRENKDQRNSEYWHILRSISKHCHYLKFPLLCSIIELLMDSQRSGNLTVLRSLRLLRIFRLIRPMRHQIAVILRTTSSVMTFFSLLFLFMFTFAVLGMNIFGGKFVFKNRYGQVVRSRSNFDSFMWAMVTVFQVGINI